MDHTDLSIIDLSQDWADLKKQLEALIDDLDRRGVLGPPAPPLPANDNPQAEGRSA